MYFILIIKENYILLLTISTSSAARITPSQSLTKFTTLLMGLSPIGHNCEPCSANEISLLEVQCTLRWWNYPSFKTVTQAPAYGTPLD